MSAFDFPDLTGIADVSAAASGRRAVTNTRPPGRTPGPHMVNFYALDGSVELAALMGNGPATLSGGVGGWQEESRRGLPPVTWWDSPPAYRQTVPVLFDAGVSQESAIGALYQLGRSDARKPPPAVIVTGPAVHRADLTWVIADIALGSDVIREPVNGDRVRQDVMVTLLHYNATEVIIERSPSKQAASKGKQNTTAGQGRRTYRVTATDTSLAKIAARKDIYGDWSKWKRIANANGIRDPKSLKVGQVLKIPR